MKRLLELGLGGSLLLFDRGYPSAAFLSHTLTAGFSFVMRVREKWNLQSDAIKDEGWITVSHEGKQFTVHVRFVKDIFQISTKTGHSKSIAVSHSNGICSVILL